MKMNVLRLDALPASRIQLAHIVIAKQTQFSNESNRFKIQINLPDNQYQIFIKLETFS